MDNKPDSMDNKPPVKQRSMVVKQRSMDFDKRSQMKVPTKWRTWYKAVLDMTVEGKSITQISKILHHSPQTITRVTHMPQFKRKYLAMFSWGRIKVVEYLKNHCAELLDNKIKLAFEAESETVRSEATSWLLERVPELSPKTSVLAQQTNIYQGSKEDDARLDTISKDMESVMERLRDGNEFVEKPAQSEGDANDTLTD